MRNLDGRRSSGCGEREKRGLRTADFLDFAEPETHDYRDKEQKRNQKGIEQTGCGRRQRGEKHDCDAQQNNQISHARRILHLFDATTVHQSGIIVPTRNSRLCQSETHVRAPAIVALNLRVFPHVARVAPPLHYNDRRRGTRANANRHFKTGG